MRPQCEKVPFHVFNGSGEHIKGLYFCREYNIF